MPRSPIFADLDFAPALARAASEKKLLLVDATASWCGPCKTMDRTTWADPAVIEGLREKALAIQIDVDAERELAKKLDIMAMPTVIAFRDGAELDRVVGLQTREELLDWLDGLARGETSLQRQRAQSASKPGDMRERMNLAQKLFSAGRLDEATTEFLWLWEHVLEHDEAMVGVRHSYLVLDLQALAVKHAPAREALAKLRDAAAPKPDAPLDANTLRDWFSLNEALGETRRSLEWFDATRPDPTSDKALARLLEHELVPMLVEATRLGDAGLLFLEPLRTLRESAEMLVHVKRLPPEMADHMRGFAVRRLRDVAALLVRALRAAHRDAESKAVAEEAARLDDSAEMAAALRAAESA